MFEFNWWLERITVDGESYWYLAVGVIHAVVYLIWITLSIVYYIYTKVTEYGFDYDPDAAFAIFLSLTLGTAFITVAWILVYPSLAAVIIYYFGIKIILPAMRKYKFKTKNDFKNKRTIIIGDEVLEVIDE